MGLPLTPADLRHRLLPIALAQGVGLACGVASVHLTTRWVAPSELGHYALFLSLVPVAMSVFHAGLIKYVARHWAQVADRRALLLRVGAAAARKLPWIALTLIGAAALWEPTTWPVVVALALPTAILVSAIQFSLTTLQALRENWADCGASTVGSLARSFIPVTVYAWSGGHAWSLMVGFLGAMTLTALTYGAAARRHLGTAPGTAPLPDWGGYGGSLFFLLAIAGWVVQSIGRWLATLYFGAEVTGHFALAANIAQIPTAMLGVVFLQYSQPRLFAQRWTRPEGRRALAQQLDALAGALTVLGGLGLAVLHGVTPALVGTWIDPTYGAALRWVLPTGCLGLAVVVGQIFQLGLLATHEERRCGPLDLGLAGVLCLSLWLGAVTAGQDGFRLSLLLSPLWPWVFYRTGVRRVLAKPSEAHP